MEHSRLLKFLVEPRYNTIMSEAEQPSIKIQKDHEFPPNISAEVPNEQAIRVMDSKEQSSTNTNTEITDTVGAVKNTSTDTEYALSPVLTVTKNETTLTKGDLKLQKVTVTEDIARHEMENGGHRLNYTEFQTNLQTNKETVKKTVMSDEYKVPTEENLEHEMNAIHTSHEQKKSKIPKLKFRQTVERVKKERREQKLREQKLKEQPHKIPRRSSIPKLKDSKLLKRQASLKHDWKPEELSTEEEMLDEVFDKIYEETVDNKSNDLDEKILTVTIDDPEKVETKFDEIIHAYDSNDDNYLTQSEKLRVSKIPWRKKDGETSAKLGSLVSKVNNKSFSADGVLKDGGFKVYANTITTKRFSRGSSTDSNNPKVDISENLNTDNANNKDISKETIIAESTENIPIKSKATISTIGSELPVDGSNSVVIDDKIYHSENDDTIEDHKISKEKITRQIKSGIPVITTRLNRSISRDINKRPATLEDRDFVNKKVLEHEEFIDSKNKTVTKETIIRENPVTTENISSGIIRTFSRDGKSVTISSKTKSIPTEDSKIPIAESTMKEIKCISKDTINLDHNNENNDRTKSDTKQGVLTTETISKENIKIVIPAFYTKVTQSYTKGTVQNVEISKTIEWKAAEEVIIKNPGRSHAKTGRQITDNIDKKNQNNTIMNANILNDKMITSTEASEISDLSIDTNVILGNKDNNVSGNDLDNTLTPTESQTKIKEYSHKPVEINKERRLKAKEIEHSEITVENKDSMKNVTILKGNVNRLLSQISVKDNKDVLKKDIDIKEDLPKKKSVLTKIALFEGKEPTESNIKIKKFTIDKNDSMNKPNEIRNAVNEINISQDKVISKNNNYDEISKTTYLGDEPVIVDQIWKNQAQDIHSNTDVYKAKLIGITPEIVDFTICDASDTTIKNVVTSPEKLEFHANEKQLLDEHLQGNFESNITMSARIDFISDENKEDVVKYSPEKVIVSPENQTEREKSKVGKLDLNFWKKQVEVNKKFVGNGTPTELSKSKGETVKATSGKYITIKDKEAGAYTSSVEDGINTEILPGRIKYISYSENGVTKNIQNELDSPIHETQLRVPVVLPETPLMEPDKINYDNEKHQMEIPIIMPEKVLTKVEIFENVEATHNINTLISTNTSTVSLKSKEGSESSSPTILEQNGHTLERTQSKTLQTQPDTMNFNSSTNNNENKILTVAAKNRAHQIGFGSEKNTASLITNTKNTNSDENNVNSEDATLLEEDAKSMEVVFPNKEISSDPELVDSEPEIKETKDTIMGKLKNKIFLITNKNINKNKSVVDRESHKIITPAPKETIAYNNVATGKIAKSLTELERSVSREDSKRSKSLAELDLGDAVKGQVQRIIYRIKSVDLEKSEAQKLNKINTKEMPKKCSVLEKIALFEEKAASNYLQGSSKLQNIGKREALKIISRNDEHSTLRTATPEEFFLQKVEDLSTARLRYEKTDMEYLELSNGVLMPVIALGTSLMDKDLAPHIVSAAIDLGFRAIDTAYVYGNEKEVGQGIKAKINDGTVERKDLFIISKLWSTFHRPDLVESACRASLDALGLEYVDLFLIHNPMSFKEGNDPIPTIASVLQFSDHDYLDAWFAMENLVQKGLVKSIGVSNFNSKQIQKIINKGRVKPVVNQVECHPYLSQERLQNFCTEHNIILSCFGIFGSFGVPKEYKNPEVKPVIDDPLVKVMASGLNVTAARLLVRYQLQSGRSVVVKSSTSAHLWDLLQALKFKIQQHEVDGLAALNKNERIFTFKGMGDTHKNYPFREPF